MFEDSGNLSGTTSSLHLEVSVILGPFAYAASMLFSLALWIECSLACTAIMSTGHTAKHILWAIATLFAFELQASQVSFAQSRKPMRFPLHRDFFQRFCNLWSLPEHLHPSSIRRIFLRQPCIFLQLTQQTLSRDCPCDEAYISISAFIANQPSSIITSQCSIEDTEHAENLVNVA